MALSNAQYDSIMRTYEEKRLLHHTILQGHYAEIYQKIPEIKTIEEKVATLSLEKARQMLALDGVASLSDLKSNISNLSLQKKALLKSNGYPSDFLDTHYDCDLCQDTGYINSEKCQCFKNAIIDLLYAQSNLKDILKIENFSHFDLSYYSNTYMNELTGKSSLETMREALDICRNFVDNFDTDPKNLFLYGDTGIGKTFLSHCIAKELMDCSHSVIYFSAFDLFDTLAKSRFSKDANAQDKNDYILDCDLLIIDDLGTELVNSFVISQFFLCINERLLRNKSTIISTNLALDSIVDIYSERIFSRITSNYTMLNLIGEDVRIKKKLINLEVQ